MKPQYLSLFVLLFHSFGSAIPFDGSLTQRRGLNVVRTTVKRDGTEIDWVPVKDQLPSGSIAAPPPHDVTLSILEAADNHTTFQPVAELQEADAETGPEGTVPILRVASDAPLSKRPPPGLYGSDEDRKRAVGDHWYASTAQQVGNHGGGASFSLYKAYAESGNDFSLLQSAVVRQNVPKPGANSQTVSQTVEAGWINYPNQVAAPHLFTFYTTDGYATIADNKGGWNRDVAGWVQTDTQIFPGSTFGPLSTRGGAQYDIKIQWLLYQGNWWLFVLDRWIGYYPGSLFSAGTDASRSLGTSSDRIHYYGEIYDSHPQLTKTDMGSGNWPEAGWQQSGYIRNMAYTNTIGIDQRYDGSREVIISDSNRYRLKADWAATTSWENYFYLGGPGAGGVIDG